MTSGKEHSFRIKWLAIIFILATFVGSVIAFKRLPLPEEAKGIIWTGIAVFIMSLPVDVSFWIQNARAVIQKVAIEEPKGEEPKGKVE